MKKELIAGGDLLSVFGASICVLQKVLPFLASGF
ncbi:hypothetical protein SAMN05216278_3811 [Halopelagius longus]|uniref:Uncharacterized protein n=1 Tax=Halopelagius longus TaxID=1236180 RepID=A0A1H1GSQ4_9EURY|nr:hypothetical protein SAMN05216278_3811 [Halopelagius longus]